MKVGVLGSGFMGGTHARAFAKQAGVEVVAVSSRNLEKAQKLAAELGPNVRATTDDNEIVNDPSIDVVSNTLPTHLHEEFTNAALKNGKHVLLEKPFALNVAACDSMIAAQKASGKTLMIAHVLRFWPEYEVLVDVVQSGIIGKPLSAVAQRLSVQPGWADWFKNPELSGGAVLDLLIHDIDALNWVLGKPKSVYARGHQAAPHLWNHVHLTVDYGHAQGWAEGTQFMPKDYPFTCGLKVLCEGGSVEFLFRAGGVSVEMGGLNSLMVYENGKSYKPDVPSGDIYERQTAYFVDCIKNGKTPEHGTPEQARLAVATSNAAYQSLETNAVVSV